MSLPAIAKGIVDVIHDEFDELEVGKKYGGTVFTAQGSNQLICGVFLYKKHISIEFSKGYLLQDLSKKLQGSGKFRRHLKIKTQYDVDMNLLKALIAESLVVH